MSTDNAVKTIEDEDTPEFIEPRFHKALPLTDEQVMQELPQFIYGSLAMDLALGFYSPAALCKKYNISSDVFNALYETEEFQNELARWKDRLKTGDGFRTRVAALAESSLYPLSHMITSSAVAPRDKLKAISMITQLAGYDNRDSASGPNVSASVTFNIAPGIRGISDGNLNGK